MNVNGVNYHVEVMGTGAPLVLLHGFTGSSVNWREHVPALAQHYRVIMPDLLGHGRTDAPADPTRYAMAHAAADVVALLDALVGDPVHLLGYSMGGRLALYIAVHYPQKIRTLTLESSSPGLRTEAERAARRERDNALAARIEREGVEAFVGFWEQLPLWDSQKQLADEKRAALRAQRLTNNPQGLANSLRGMGTGVQPSLWGDLETIEAPVWLINGNLDAKFLAISEQMTELLTLATHIRIGGAGHTTHLEKPYEFQQTVLEFLRGDL